MRRVGASLMAGSFALGLLLTAIAPAAVAQEAAPEDAEPVTVEKAAFYEHPYNEAAPNTAVAEFPPGVFCLVAPGAPVCQPNPVSDGVEGGIGAVQEGEPASPESPVPPDTLPASLLGGERRYESAVKFALPTVPAGEAIDTFTLVLTETQPTYHSSSPIFRRAVLAALACVRECDRQEEFQKVLAEQPAESAVLGVEVCPLAEDFEEGRSQPASARPPVNELYCATAERVEGGNGLWTVDLTFAAMAWSEGELPNHGVGIRPLGAPNVAYGDPDPTTNAQVTFEQQLAAATTTAPAQDDPPAFDSGSGGFDSGGGSDVGTGSSSGGFSSDSGGFAAPSGGSSGGLSSDPFSAPGPVTADDAGAAPEVAPDDAAGEVAAPADAPVAGPDTQPVAAGSTWWLWLLVPIFALGSWMTAQSLSAEAIVSTGAISRNGAMTRLIARNTAGGSSTPMTQV